MKIYIIAFLSLILTISCNDFTDVEPKGITTPETVQDYSQLLDGLSYISSIVSEDTRLLTDQMEYFPSNRVNKNKAATSKELAYTWADQIYVEDVTPILWISPYQKIFSYNLVINEVLSATGGTETQKLEVKSEALVGRALEYFYLINTFAKPYNKSSSKTDLGVPFVESSDVRTPIPDRGTVKKVYDRIIEDISKAIKYLPSTQSHKWRFSKLSAKAILARIYYYKGDYKNSLRYTEEVLNKGYTLLDYNNFETSKERSKRFGGGKKAKKDDITKIRIIDNPEEIFMRRAQKHYTPFQTSISKDLLSLYGGKDTKDLRFAVDYYEIQGSKNTKHYAYYSRTGDREINAGVSFPELLLIKAEAEARLGNLTAAMDALNTLRVKRFKPVDYVAFSSTNKEDIINKILDERRLEFHFRGLRWLDMRKSSAEGRIGFIKHMLFGKIYTLEPGSPKYTLQIPQFILNFNPKMKQNPR